MRELGRHVATDLVVISMWTLERVGDRERRARERRDRRPPTGEDHHRERDVAAAAGHVGREPGDRERELRPTCTGERTADERRRTAACEPATRRRRATRRADRRPRAAAGPSACGVARAARRSPRRPRATRGVARTRCRTAGARRRVRAGVVDDLHEEARAGERDQVEPDADDDLIGAEPDGAPTWTAATSMPASTPAQIAAASEPVA